MINIKHEPIVDVKKAAELYTKQDGVEITYVCTSAPSKEATIAADIFYRETPHPQFGNRYFGLYWHRVHFELPAKLMITNADAIEDFEFGMIEGEEGEYHYSQHRHDRKVVGDKMIDGGRSYIRQGVHPVDVFKIKDGEFIRA